MSRSSGKHKHRCGDVVVNRQKGHRLLDIGRRLPGGYQAAAAATFSY